MTELLRMIDENMSEDDAMVVFRKFDDNCDSKISFQEFYKNMCLITGSPS
jgi:Ca2+-binding EF-hand superfamily protein